jgi:hypothetical protein
LRAVDPIMIGQDDGGEANLPAATSNLIGRHSAIKGSRTMHVEINPDNVRYYKRRRRALRRDQAAGVYHEGWRLTGKERLSFCNNGSPWN